MKPFSSTWLISTTSHCRETHCAIRRTIVKPSVPVENPKDSWETAPEQWRTKTLPCSLVCGAAYTASHYLRSKTWSWASVQVIGENDAMHYSDICWTNCYMQLRQSNSTNLKLGVKIVVTRGVFCKTKILLLLLKCKTSTKIWQMFRKMHNV